MAHKPLKDFTNEELYSWLENNEINDISALGPICSEILRRILIEKTIKIKE